jgi:GDSL-like Lipase/Acylhydrolase family
MLKRALGLLACGSTTAILVHAPPAVASPAPRAHRAEYYLALGDSVPVWNGARSYPYLLLAHYRRRLPGLTLDDIAVSGETTSSMLDGGQYAGAIRFLRAHRGHVALITIDIGGNDIVGCALSIEGARPDSPCALQARATIKRNIRRMLAGLHAGAPGVPVIGMTYYDPLLGDWLAGGSLRTLAVTTVSGLVALNRELTSLYGGRRRTADVQGVFRATDLKTMVPSPWGTVPIAVKRACSWLDIVCESGAAEILGDDPNEAGAVAISTAFERTINRLVGRHR